MFDNIERLQRELAQLEPLSYGQLKYHEQERAAQFSWHSLALSDNYYNWREGMRLLLHTERCLAHPYSDATDLIFYRDIALQNIRKWDTGNLSYGDVLRYHSYAFVGHDPLNGAMHLIRYYPDHKKNPRRFALMGEEITRILKEADFSKSGKHPIETAALCHLQFVKLAPFYFANRRTARLITLRQIVGAGYPPCIFHANKKRNYHNALHRHSQTADSLPMIDYLEDSIAEALREEIAIRRAAANIKRNPVAKGLAHIKDRLSQGENDKAYRNWVLICGDV